MSKLLVSSHSISFLSTEYRIRVLGMIQSMLCKDNKERQKEKKNMRSYCASKLSISRCCHDRIKCRGTQTIEYSASSGCKWNGFHVPQESVRTTLISCWEDLHFISRKILRAIQTFKFKEPIYQKSHVGDVRPK